MLVILDAKLGLVNPQTLFAVGLHNETLTLVIFLLVDLFYVAEQLFLV